jgi:hypothetical protein
MLSFSELAKRARLVAPLTALLSFGTSAIALALPIDTGYNYQTYSAYPAPPLSGNSTITDNYWINIASYLPPSMSSTVAPSSVIKNNPPWQPPFAPSSRWIGPLPTWNSPAGSTGNDHAWTLFRKCFCLAPNFNGATLSFQARHDESLQIMLNSMTNTVYGPALANFGNPTVPLVTLTAGQLSSLHAGKNCIYALLEDTGGAMGWDLMGNFNANGLYPYAAAGAQQSFPCDCGGHGGPVPNGPSGIAARSMQADDSDVVAAIVKVAESRRKAALLQRKK